MKMQQLTEKFIFNTFCNKSTHTSPQFTAVTYFIQWNKILWNCSNQIKLLDFLKFEVLKERGQNFIWCWNYVKPIKQILRIYFFSNIILGWKVIYVS